MFLEAPSDARQGARFRPRRRMAASRIGIDLKRSLKTALAGGWLRRIGRSVDPALAAACRAVLDGGGPGRPRSFVRGESREATLQTR
jgi:hypothetical protein